MTELVVENGMDFEYTSQLRQDEGSLIFVGSGLVGIFAIPPQSPSFDIVGHCSGRCTSEMIPLTGAEVQAVALHTHVTGRRMRLKQIRGNTELPWIENDDNYEFAYQPLRLINDPPTIRPGDQLTMQCNYDNTGTNGSTSSGYATRDEMCTAFILLNKKVPYLLCSSEYPSEKLFNRFGIRNMTWELERHERIVTSAVDPSNEGLSMGEVVGNWSSWTTQERTEWEREMMYSNHNGNCPNVRVVGQLAYAIIRLQEATGGLITVPVIEEANPTRQSMRTPIPAGPVSYPIGITTYVPPNACRNVDPFSNTNNPLGGLGGGATLLPNIPQLFRERLNTLLPNSSQNAFGGFINRFTG
ncbi:DBH-like monooxygenase protein 1 [Orchesella cincta]|uniref:DBH-like monooxygenase protein 1 n=1 Tax=Orchesella cincta TaxID=48709 RepID=A0A1D2NBA2_ORCCI|nr:DBH-like monooxygenase protein 1 [Orchesella cincta]